MHDLLSRIRTRVLVDEAALKSMVAEVARWHPKETGGLLVGYWAKPFGVAVITGVVGPGPGAEHSEADFRPDTDWQAGQIAETYRKSGRTETYMGDWHNHPNTSLRPSKLDRQAANEIAKFEPARVPVPLMLLLKSTDEGVEGYAAYHYFYGRLVRCTTKGIAEP